MLPLLLNSLIICFQQAFDEAIAELDILNDSYNFRMRLLAALRDNLILWTSDTAGDNVCPYVPYLEHFVIFLIFHKSVEKCFKFVDLLP